MTTDHDTRRTRDGWVAPWTPGQVEALNAVQADGRFHGYTCPGDHCCTGLTRKLVATADGWVCDCGNYTQGWAHAVPLAGVGRVGDATDAGT